MQLAIGVLGRGLRLNSLIPAMPILFTHATRARKERAELENELDEARDRCNELEQAARLTLERFLASTGSPAVVDGGFPLATLTRLEACLAGLAAAPEDDAPARAWRAKLDAARTRLAAAVACERSLRFRLRSHGGPN